MSWHVERCFSSKSAAREALLDEFEGTTGKFYYVPKLARAVLVTQVEMLPDAIEGKPAIVFIKSNGHTDNVNGNMVSEARLVYLD